MAAHCTLKIDKAREALGYQPVISITEGLAKMKINSNTDNTD
jgi:nucleoside-diphosphate-sugar epimerase